jgi:hypothetical protein
MRDPAPPRRRTHGGTGAGALALVKPLPPKAVAEGQALQGPTPLATIATSGRMGCGSRPCLARPASRRALCHPFEIQKRPKKEGYKPNFYSAIPYAIYAHFRRQDRPAEVQVLGMGTLLAGSLASFRKTLRYFYPVQETAEALRTEATGQKSRSTASRRISTGKRARRAFVNSASRSVLIPWFRSCETSAAALCEASPRFAPHRAGRHRTRPHRWR